MLFFRRRRRLFGVAEASGVTVLIAVSVGALSLPRICKTTSPSFAAGCCSSGLLLIAGALFAGCG